MFRFRRIMYTSSGSGEPGGASLTSTTDAAGFGSTGVFGAVVGGALMLFEKPSCRPRSNHGVSVAADASEPQARSRPESGGLGGCASYPPSIMNASRTPPASQINQLCDPLAM